MVTCNECGKEFDSRPNMDQHYSAKHAKQPVETPTPRKSKKKPIFMITGIVIVLIIGYFMFFNNGSEEKPIIVPGDDISINLDEVPKRAIHWHPTLTVIINGDANTIPANLGGRPGAHLPIHTHDTTGKLHMESNRPTPETVILGYFFDRIYGKTFNSNCIYDECNGPEGSMTMTVNGEPNFKFDKYVMKDNDNIVIEFSNIPAVPATENTTENSTESTSEKVTEVTNENATEIATEPVREVKEFEITARQWEFIPSTITVNKGDLVKLNIKSVDVTHGIALPDFGINSVLNRGQETNIEFVADKEGVYSFFCSVQCGIGHGNMRGRIVVN